MVLVVTPRSFFASFRVRSLSIKGYYNVCLFKSIYLETAAKAYTSNTTTCWKPASKPRVSCRGHAEQKEYQRNKCSMSGNELRKLALDLRNLSSIVFAGYPTSY